MNKNNTKSQKSKIVVFLAFIVLLFSGVAFMYTKFIKGNKAVEPTTVPYRTKQNPFIVDSLKKAGYYDTLGNY